MTKYTFVSFVMVCTALMLQTSAFAADGSSGCGLGWKVAPKNSLLSSTTRSYINATFSNTVGMTSGTSGCQKHSLVQEDKRVIHFVEANYGQLMIELARGEGEHLRGLAMTMGCAADELNALSTVGQNNYSRLFPAENASPGQMVQEMRALIREQPLLAGKCGLTV